MKRLLPPPFASLFRLLLLLPIAFGTPRLLALNVTLAWNANPEPDVAGYRLYYGTPAGNFGTMVNVGKPTIQSLDRSLVKIHRRASY